MLAGEKNKLNKDSVEPSLKEESQDKKSKTGIQGSNRQEIRSAREGRACS